VTIVDATLVRHHPAAYDDILAGQPAAERRLIETTLAGLRFVRNQMGQHLDPADFICPGPGRPGRDKDRIAAWTWKSLPEPHSLRFRPAGGPGSGRDTAPTRRSSPVIRSGARSAGPRRSSNGPPPTRTSITNISPHLCSAAPAGFVTRLRVKPQVSAMRPGTRRDMA
jgi:hypothetical protein